MIFFFDIDGVFTSHRTNIGALNIGGMFEEFDRYVVGMMNTLGKATDAKAVIISSWRLGEDAKDIPLKMKKAGLIIPFHEDWCAPAHEDGDSNRGAIILNWCKAHGVETNDIFIFDDGDNGYTNAGLSERFVKSNNDEGFGVAHFREAQEKLGLSISECRNAQIALKDEISPGTRMR